MCFLVLFLALALGGTGAAPPIQSRVVGGSDCPKNSQPWQVAVYHFTRFQCGGVLIDPKWVLTAAHCLNDYYQIWVGRDNLFEDEPDAQHRLVSESFLHPNFNVSLLKNHTQEPGEDYSHDLMLLRLKEPVDITDAVQVLPLPTEDPELGSTCLASGWGSIEPTHYKSADDLQCVELDLLPNEYCVKAHPEKVTEFMLCAGILDGGKDTCSGDSGGPLICDGMLQGITSFGSVPCGVKDKPGIYTKLIHYIDWINDIMENNS